jgi:hypothetical protein
VHTPTLTHKVLVNPWMAVMETGSRWRYHVGSTHIVYDIYSTTAATAIAAVLQGATATATTGVHIVYVSLRGIRKEKLFTLTGLVGGGHYLFVDLEDASVEAQGVSMEEMKMEGTKMGGIDGATLQDRCERVLRGVGGGEWDGWDADQEGAASGIVKCRGQCKFMLCWSGNGGGGGSGHHGLSLGPIVGVVIAGVAAAALALFFALTRRRRVMRSRKVSVSGGLLERLVGSGTDNNGPTEPTPTDTSSRRPQILLPEVLMLSTVGPSGERIALSPDAKEGESRAEYAETSASSGTSAISKRALSRRNMSERLFGANVLTPDVNSTGSGAGSREAPHQGRRRSASDALALLRKRRLGGTGGSGISGFAPGRRRSAPQVNVNVRSGVHGGQEQGMASGTTIELREVRPAGHADL